jgi:hypothetical protein
MLLAIAIGTAFAPAAAVAKDKAPPPPPPGFTRLVACQNLRDSAQRLACYDREVSALSKANSTGDLVVMDRQQIRKTRRSLFGLALPDLGVFGDSSSLGDAAQLETTIKVARQDGNGRWTFDLTEGGRWVQLDSNEFILDPAPGQKVRIRRASMGSYLMNVNPGINPKAITVMRVN